MRLREKCLVVSAKYIRKSRLKLQNINKKKQINSDEVFRKNKCIYQKDSKLL